SLFVTDFMPARAIGAKVSANQFRNVVIQRAGVRLLVRDSKLREQVENLLRLHLELSRQLVNADFLHITETANLTGRHTLHVHYPRPAEPWSSILPDSLSSADRSSAGV